MGWQWRQLDHMQIEFLAPREAPTLTVFWRLFVLHFGSWASLCAVDSNDLPGQTVLPMTEFEGPSECTYYMVTYQYNVGRLTGATLNLTR